MKRTANRLYRDRFGWDWCDHLDWRGQRPDTPKGNPKKYHREWSKTLRAYLKRETDKEIKSSEEEY